MLQYRSDLLASAHIASNELKMKQEKLERLGRKGIGIDFV